MSARKWTDEEKDYLRENWGRTPIGSIAKKLGRSENAILIKAARWHLGAFLDAGDYISLNQLAVIFGQYNVKTIWVREGLPTHNKKVRECRFAIVKLSDFWEWAKDHRELVNFSRLGKYDLGPEPKWVEKARKVDSEKNRKRKWTKAEDGLLENMVKRGCHIDEIARKLQRSENTIRSRIYDLALPYKIPRRKSKPWNDDEIEKMLQLRADGHSWEKIGEQLERSAQSCVGKYERLCNPQYLPAYRARTGKGALRDCFQRDQCVHYKLALGCERNGTNCDDCEFFQRRKDDDENGSGWNSANRINTAKELLEKFRAGKETS